MHLHAVSQNVFVKQFLGHGIKLAQSLLRCSMNCGHGKFTLLDRVTKLPMQVIASAT
jgi:hypothetical protein